MSKFLLQFYKKVYGAEEKRLPDLVPEMGVIAEISRAKLGDLIDKTFDKFPYYYMAAISIVEKAEAGEHEFSRFDSFALNEEWDEQIFEAEVTKEPRVLFEMRK